MVPIIKTDGLTKDYGRVRGLDNLTLEVQEGEVLASWDRTVPARPPPSGSCST